MTYRKTWFSYVLWAVYAGLCIMLLTFMGFDLFAGYISSSMARIGGLLIFPIAVGAYWGIRIISQMIRKKYVMHMHTANMLEFFVVAISVVFGIMAPAFLPPVPEPCHNNLHKAPLQYHR